jgi:hypothetical protein
MGRRPKRGKERGNFAKEGEKKEGALLKSGGERERTFPKRGIEEQKSRTRLLETSLLPLKKPACR